MITLRQMRFFVALAEELNFSRAAEVCFVTQPTLSSAIAEMEAMLGVQLAERTKRTVLLTPVGEEIALRARVILAQAEDLMEAAKAAGHPEAGPLRLGAIPTVGPFLIPRALPAIRADFPDLKLYLREELTESLLDGLWAGRLDVILIALPFDLGQVAYETLFLDGYHLAAPPEGGDLPPIPTSGDLEGVQLMLLEPGHCLQRHALKAFPDAQLAQDESFAATSLSTLVSMVSEGLGITLLPDLAVDAGAARGMGVDLRPLPEACPREVVLAWRPSSARAPLFAKLAAHFRKARAEMAARG